MTRDVFEFARWNSDPTSILVAAGLFVALVAFLLMLYRRDAQRLTPALRHLLFSLRLGVCLLLLWVFLDPQVRTETTTQDVSRVVVAIDQSLSMTITDGDSRDDTIRKDRFYQVISELQEGPFLPGLRPTHETILAGFGKSLRAIGRIPKADESSAAPSGSAAVAWSELAAADEETRIGDALSDIFREHRASQLAAVVLITDGQSNAGAAPDSVARLAKESGAPIFPVGVGDDRPPRNLRVSDIQIPAKAYPGDVFRGKALVHGLGLSGQETTIEVWIKPRDQDAPLTQIHSQKIEIPADDAVVPIEFDYMPELSGQWQMVVRTTELPRETRSDDNSASAGFEVVDQKTNLLLFAGGPTREYRFLRNLLFREPSVEAAVFLQTSTGSAQEGNEVLAILPESREELFQFDVIVAIDPDWSAIAPEMLDLLQEWVSSHAGGLILVAGPVYTSQIPRLPNREVLDALYPVVLKEVFTSDFDAGRYVQPWPVKFTAEGELASYLRLDEDVAESRRLWQEFEGVYWSFPVSGIKPAATALANFEDPRSRVGGLPPPIFATQFYGAGRIFYFGTGETWRLRQLGESVFDRFWIRLIRELSQGRMLRGASRARLLIESDRFAVGTNVTVRAQVLGSDYQPLLDPTVPLSVVDPSANATTVLLTPQVDRSGLYSANVPLPMSGEYRLQLLVPGSIEVVEQRVTAEIPERELADPRLNRSVLDRLATLSGGRAFSLEQLAEIPPLIEDRTESTIHSGVPRTLWDNVWIMLAITLIASTEWLIRKLVYLA